MRKIFDNISNMNFRDWLAMFLVTAFVATLFYCLRFVLPEQNKDLTTYMLGQLSGFVGTAIALYFGASQSDEKRAETDRHLTQTLAETAKAVATAPSGAEGDPLHTIEEGKAE